MPNKGCIIRLSRYKNAAYRLKAMNFVRIFSDNLADAAGVTAAQVRKDFSLFGITGNRRGGYKVDELIMQLNKVLGKDQVREFILVGAGNIGRALMRYPGFEKSGLRIIGAFDIDPGKYAEDGPIPVMAMDKIHDFVKEKKVRFGIIAVPDYAAPQVLELMKKAGIKGVLSFAPICLKETPDCVISNINLVTELENIVYFVGSGKEMRKQ